MGKYTKWADMTDEQRKEARAKQESELKRLQEMIVKGAEEAASNSGWAEWLTTAVKFWDYSPRNQQLIRLQTFGEAELVAGFNMWRKCGRRVKKGEKAIRILAPNPVRWWEDEDGNRYKRGDDIPDGAKEGGFMAYRTVSVFDISQTEGEPLEIVRERVWKERGGGWTLLDSQDDKGVYELLRRFAESRGIECEEKIITDRKHGYAYGWSRISKGVSSEGSTIVIDRALSMADKAITLAHELGHVLAGHTALIDVEGKTREERELEAGSIAFIVSSLLGIDCSERSFAYVGDWSGFDSEKVLAVQGTVTRVVKEFMEGLAELDSRAIAA